MTSAVVRRLSTWGQIAAHLGLSSIDTAQRWARDRGMPVFKAPGGRVEADPVELDDWYSRNVRRFAAPCGTVRHNAA